MHSEESEQLEINKRWSNTGRASPPVFKLSNSDKINLLDKLLSYRLDSVPEDKFFQPVETMIVYLLNKLNTLI